MRFLFLLVLLCLAGCQTLELAPMTPTVKFTPKVTFAAEGSRHVVLKPVYAAELEISF